VPHIDDENISAPLSQAIEDAILFGHIKELDAILDQIEDDKDFPTEILYGLQALRHFRANYGTEGAMEPEEGIQKQKAVLMESAWGAELLDKLRREYKIVALRQA
jgi:hypothetical protein